MAKVPKRGVSMEIEEIRQRLTNQDRMLEQISNLLKGSVNLNMQGLIPMINEMEKSISQIVTDVAHLQRWKKREQESKGTFTIRTSVLITRVLAGVGACATVVGIVIGGIQIYDWYNLKKENREKQKSETPRTESLLRSQNIFQPWQSC